MTKIILDEELLKQEIEIIGDKHGQYIKNSLNKFIRIIVSDHEYSVSNEDTKDAMFILLKLETNNHPKVTGECVKHTYAEEEIIGYKDILDGSSVKEAKELLVLFSRALHNNEQYDGWNEYQMQKACVSSMLFLNGFSILEKSTFKGTPVCICLRDETDGNIYNHLIMSINGKTKLINATINEFF